MSKEEKRKYEEKLVLAYEAIPFAHRSSDWWLSEEYLNFLEAWRALREVFINHDTLVDFHVEVVGMYLNLTERLRKLINRTNDNTAKEKISYALKQVEFWMNELINEAQRNQYYIEDMEDDQ